MIFEEALAHLRLGKKIRHPDWSEDVFLAGCYVTLKTMVDYNGKELIDDIEEAKKRGMSIIKCKGDYQHIDMFSRNFPDRQPCCNPDLHSYPQLNLFLVMSEDWEVLE